MSEIDLNVKFHGQRCYCYTIGMGLICYKYVRKLQEIVDKIVTIGCHNFVVMVSKV